MARTPDINPRFRVVSSPGGTSRRDFLVYSGGLAGLLAFGFPSTRVAAQDESGPAALVNPEGEAPAEASGELTMALAFDPVNLDSVATYTVSNARWEGAVYSPLTWRDPDLVLYDGLDGRPGPADGFGLAESWNYVDDLTLEMKLKEGITFHDGEALTSASVQRHFERMADPELASPQAFNYSTIESVEVVDDYNLIFHFNTVDPVMITKFAGYGAYITPDAGSQVEGFGTSTVTGTGPFRVVEYVADDHLTLEAWDGFWGSQKPLISRLTYRVIPDDNTRLAELMAGNVDIASINVNQVDPIEGNPDLSVVTIGAPTVSGLRLDATQAPTDDIHVRLAIAHAIDLQTIIDTILGGYATSVPVWQSPFSFGFDDTLTPYAYDPEGAAQHLAESGLEMPVALTFDILSGNSQVREFADAVKGMLDEAGFSTEVRIQESATYFDDYRFGNLGNICWFGWGGWTLDFDNTYYSMYKTGESYNPGFSNAEVDDLLVQQRATLDQAERLDIAKQINAILIEEAPDVALYQSTTLWAVNNNVHNLYIPPDERFWWAGAWID